MCAWCCPVVWGGTGGGASVVGVPLARAPAPVRFCVPPFGARFVPHRPMLPVLPTRLDKVLQIAGGWHKHAAEAALRSRRVMIVEGAYDAEADSSTGTDCGSGAAVVVTEGAHLVFPTDAVLVDGSALPPQVRAGARAPRVYALHKPKGMEVDLSNRRLRTWFAALAARGLDDAAAPAASAPADARDLMHVGRLDKRTSGLLLVTDDGDLCSCVCAPGQCVKVYTAVVRCTREDEPTAEQLARLRTGLELDDGWASALRCDVLEKRVKTFTPSEKPPARTPANGNGQRGGRVDIKTTAPATAAAPTAPPAAPTRTLPTAPTVPAQTSTVRPPGEAVGDVYIDYHAVVEIAVDVGRFRVVRRLLAAVGLPVAQLHRESVGPISFAALAAAGSPLAGPGTAVTVPPQLVGELWATLGGRAGVWQRRLTSLQTHASSPSTAGTATEGDESVEGSGNAAAPTKEVLRLRQWLDTLQRSSEGEQ